MVLEKKIFKGFYHIWAWQTFWSMDHAHFSNFSFFCPRIWATLAQSFRGEVIWNYQHFVHTNVWGPYKCLQKQTSPRRKKVKCQCITIILATLVDLPFPMIYAKIQPQGIFGLEKKIFKVFFPDKCIRKPTWPCRKKVKCQCTTIILANLVDPPVLDDLCKDSAQRHPGFWRRRCLKVFTIYRHGGHLGQQTVTILAIFRSPNLRSSIWNLSKIGSGASVEKSFENVNGHTDAWTDGRRTKSDHYSSSWA